MKLQLTETIEVYPVAMTLAWLGRQILPDDKGRPRNFAASEIPPEWLRQVLLAGKMDVTSPGFEPMYPDSVFLRVGNGEINEVSLADLHKQGYVTAPPEITAPTPVAPKATYRICKGCGWRSDTAKRDHTRQHTLLCCSACNKQVDTDTTLHLCTPQHQRI